jgi:hypothetical protein
VAWREWLGFAGDASTWRVAAVWARRPRSVSSPQKVGSRLFDVSERAELLEILFVAFANLLATLREALNPAVQALAEAPESCRMGLRGILPLLRIRSQIVEGSLVTALQRRAFYQLE